MTDQRRSDGRLTSALMAGVWLVFLVMPVAMILNSDAPPASKTLAWTGLAAFAAVYLWTFAALRHQSQARADRIMAVSCGLLALADVFMWPTIGVGVIATVPYFGAVLLFPSPIRRAPWIIAGTVLAAVLVALLDLSVWQGGASGWVLIGPLIGLFCVAAGRFAEQSEQESMAARQALALTEERARIGRDVHDLLGHSLTAISIRAQLAARLVDTDPAAARREIDGIQALTREGLAQVRAAVTEIRSESLEDVVAKSREALESAGVRFAVTGEPPAPGTAAAALFSAALREAVTNILRHARASSCTATLAPDSITVEDDGAGITLPHAEGHGLTGLRQRVENAGGRLELSTGPGGRGVRLGITMDS